jgi:hypothetical protein
LKRIHAGALDGKAPMKVRTRNASGRAYFSEHLAKLEIVTDLDVNLRKVTVEGVNAETVVNDDGISGKEQLLRKSHSAALGGMNGSTRGRGEIHAAVG